jgi:integrase
MLDGVDPNARRRERVASQQRQEWEQCTFREMIAHHDLNMQARRCSARSVKEMHDEVRRYVSDWQEKPLIAITASDCVSRHRKITRDNGPYVANRLMRSIKACWNDIRKVHHQLPPCPVFAITPNKESRRREPFTEGLRTWWLFVSDLPPVRRDLHIFLLLTGLRSTDARTVTWGDIDWPGGSIHRPNPKGGRSFDVPLSNYVLLMLAKRKLDNRARNFLTGDGDWVFPMRNKNKGRVQYITEAREQRTRKVDGRMTHITVLPTPHRCRDSFLSIGETRAKVDYVSLALLANHKLPSGNVTFGYVRPDMEHLRDCTNRITAEILKLAGVDVRVKFGA